jgi:ABC-type nitrate/sulfonate/bicarbonate transport system substrate-binding protein
MSKFIIEPHFRLHEWVAEEKGYFKSEGLDYEFRELVASTAGQIHATANKVGAFQSLEAGRKSDISCACHWTVAVAGSKGHGKLYAGCYSVSPAGVFVPADSPVKHPQDLAGVPISVGYQSGSHYSTIQALEQYMPHDRINLNFGDGLLFARMDKLLEGQSPACALFSGPYYFAEQLGYRKVIDTTFMIATFINGEPDPKDVAKYMKALQKAQRDIDLRPDLCNHYYAKEFPEKYHARMDPRRWGPGERIVFEPYTKETFDETFKWIDERGIFEDGLGSCSYENSIACAAE